MHERDVVEPKLGLLGIWAKPLQKPDFRVVVRLSISALNARQRRETYAYYC